MKIGILQTGRAQAAIAADHDEVDLWFLALLDGNDFEFETWMVVDGDLPDGPEAADGWLITGSKHGAYEDHPWIPPLEALIRAIHTADRPLVGICFGHQIIAQALGGRVEKFAGGWAIGQQTYQTPEGELTLNAWHQDQVTKLPPGAQRLASNGFCENAILAYGKRVLPVQAHPEFSEDFTADMLRHRTDTVPADVVRGAEARNGSSNDNAVLAQMLSETLRGAT